MDPKVSALIQAWDWSYLDLEPAFDGLGQEFLHRRPNSRTLSIAEIAAHTVYSEASIILRYLLGVPKQDWGISPLLQDPFGWPPTILERRSSPTLLGMTPGDLHEQWFSEHRRFIAAMNDYPLAADHQFQDEWSDAAPDVETRLRFAAYHVAYHVGQIYSHRHFLGDDTPDN